MAETVRADETCGRAGPRVRHSFSVTTRAPRGHGQCGHRDRRTQPTGTPDPRGAETRTTRTGDLRVPPLHRVATRGVANATGKRTPVAAFACVYGNGNGTRAHPRVELNRCVR